MSRKRVREPDTVREPEIRLKREPEKGADKHAYKGADKGAG